ncbi:MAG TPA: PspA/IM30 family protein, partial [Ktedonobacteraceae bacterium]|nr:PspA/IM30 family protein [Ktedonobacteraceae bacterium]
MGFFSRLLTFFRIRANAALDKAEDPGQVMDFSYQEQLKQLQNLKRSLADVVTQQKLLEGQQEAMLQRVNKYDQQAMQALQGNREDLAREALQRKEALLPQLSAYEQQIAQLRAQGERLITMERTVSARVEQFRTQKEMVKAQKRLSEEMIAGHPLFSSDLTAKELLLTRQQEYQPLSQVMGSSIYHVGWQYTASYPRATVSYELQTISNAHLHAAQLALGRLEQEASLLKAHGIIGVRLTTRDYEWGNDMIEYTAIGTAIRLPNAPLHPRPFLSDLSGQEFWTLLRTGHRPVGMVMGNCVYHVGRQGMLASLKQVGRNVEMPNYTQALYEARELAMERMQREA